jgi:hypothetical protein
VAALYASGDSNVYYISIEGCLVKESPVPEFHR